MKYLIVITILFEIFSFKIHAEWVEQTSNTNSNLTAVHFIDEQTGWAVGDNGAILKTINAGSDWSLISGLPTGKLFSVIFFQNNTTGWIVGEFGSIYKTTDSGNSWNLQASPTSRWLRSIDFVDDNTAFICGDRGTVLKTTDGGATWLSLTSNTFENLSSIQFIDENKGWVVGEFGTILSTTDAGINWYPQDSGTNQNLTSVHFVNESTGWVTGSSGVILSTVNSGEDWGSQNSNTNTDLRDISFSDVNNGIAVGANGKILSTIDSGENWNEESTTVNLNLNSCATIHSNSSWAVGDNGTILIKVVNVVVAPEETIVNNSDQIKIDINVEDINNLFGVSIQISFDDNIIRCDNIEQGDFLINNSGNDDVIFNYLPETPTSSNNFIIDQAILGTSPVSGTGTIVSLYFTPIAAGASNIALDVVHLRDNYNHSFSTNAINGIITVSLPTVSAKVFLEGAYLSGEMSTDLNSMGVLPISHPYSNPPWNHSGDESVEVGFFENHPDIVDWVLIELRTSTTGDSKELSRAAFIKKDGMIVDLDGESPVSVFAPIDGQEFYLVIRHRNHLPIMSSLPFQINENTPLYNFTNAAGKSYGLNSMVDFGDGSYGMYAGDANGNGQIQNNDSESFWRVQNGISGYLNSDFNLNGEVQNNDREVFWRINNGLGTRVPD